MMLFLRVRLQGRQVSYYPPLVGKGPILIDLSGDFRLQNPASYEAWYGKKAHWKSFNKVYMA
ncbi:hypothetical protein [Lysinibacillus sp. NPDC093688]|uniref:hypothetical protein n=1 Tax=Lysinibacillus sp. NPDC093688 TaxID=3390577 RepID=UPI003CFCEB09